MNTRGHLVSDTNSKHSPTPSKINTKPHLKIHLSQFLVSSTACPALNKNLQVVVKGEKQKFEEIKHTPELDSDIVEILELSDEEVKL